MDAALRARLGALLARMDALRTSTQTFARNLIEFVDEGDVGDAAGVPGPLAGEAALAGGAEAQG